jgi:hypothetical protein
VEIPGRRRFCANNAISKNIVNGTLFTAAQFAVNRFNFFIYSDLEDRIIRSGNLLS